MKGDFIMIDGWPEAWEQECMSYLMAREYTTPAEFADHFHLSDQSAAYWLGCMVKCGRVRESPVSRGGQSMNPETLQGRVWGEETYGSYRVKEVCVLITLKVDLGSHSRFVPRKAVKRGQVMGLSPYFDDQVVLSPFDGIIERIKCDPEEQAILLSIRRQRMQWQAAHS